MLTDYAPNFAESNLLHQVIVEYFYQYSNLCQEQGRSLPNHVIKTFEEYIRCGDLAFGFCRVRCKDCGFEHLIALRCKRRGFCPTCAGRTMMNTVCHWLDNVLPHQPIRQWVLSVPYPLRLILAQRPDVVTKIMSRLFKAISNFLMQSSGIPREIFKTGSLTVIQRFGSALNLNIHFHILFLDGGYQIFPDNQLGEVFIPVKKIKRKDIDNILSSLVHRIAKDLEGLGLIERCEDSYYLTEQTSFEFDTQADADAHSIAYKIAVGPNRGRKVFTLGVDEWSTVKSISSNKRLCSNLDGFSLHAAVACKADQRDRLEKLCRYICRPAIANSRLELLSSGNIKYELKTPFRDGTTDIIFEPLDFISKLCALVPAPYANLIRYHGVFAPNHKYRNRVVKSKSKTPAKHGSASISKAYSSFAELLKRTFSIDLNVCPKCNGTMSIISCIRDPKIICLIINHISKSNNADQVVAMPPKARSRAPP